VEGVGGRCAVEVGAVPEVCAGFEDWEDGGIVGGVVGTESWGFVSEIDGKWGVE
jgi:hypothetical protein